LISYNICGIRSEEKEQLNTIKMKNIAELLNRHGMSNQVKIHATCPTEVIGEILFHSNEFDVHYVTSGFSDGIPRVFVIPALGKGNTIEAILDVVLPKKRAKDLVSELSDKSPLEILMDALVGKAIFPKLAPFDKFSTKETPEVINDGSEYQILQFDIIRRTTAEKPRIDRFEIVPKDKTRIGFTVVTRTFLDNSEAIRLHGILTKIKI
jgi:hypothetical protein